MGVCVGGTTDVFGRCSNVGESEVGTFAWRLPETSTHRIGALGLLLGVEGRFLTTFLGSTDAAFGCVFGGLVGVWWWSFALGCSQASVVCLSLRSLCVVYLDFQVSLSSIRQAGQD